MDSDDKLPPMMKPTLSSSSDGGTAKLNNTSPSSFTRGKPQMPRRGRKADILQAMSAKLLNLDTPPIPIARKKSGGNRGRKADILQASMSAKLVSDDTPPIPIARRKSRGKIPRAERPATPAPSILGPSIILDPLDQARSFPANDLEDDEDEEEKSSLCTGIPALKQIREGQDASSSFQSSFSCVFGASQDSDFPLAHPSRCLSPMVSPAGKSSFNDPPGYMLAVSPAAAALLFLGTSMLNLSDSLPEL
jgi:hypothetical protein